MSYRRVIFWPWMDLTNADNTASPLVRGNYTFIIPPLWLTSTANFANCASGETINLTLQLPRKRAVQQRLKQILQPLATARLLRLQCARTSATRAANSRWSEWRERNWYSI